jgi:hypothetical protein
MPLEDEDNQGGTELHLQWTSIRQPRINKNHDRLIEEEHAIVRIRIEWCKDKA